MVALLDIEVDIDIGKNGQKTFFPGTCDAKAGRRFRGRRHGGGLDLGPTLLYAKGGFAWLESNLSVRATSFDPATGQYAAFSNGSDSGAPPFAAFSVRKKPRAQPPRTPRISRLAIPFRLARPISRPRQDSDCCQITTNLHIFNELSH
ncbi:MAG: hypothetical protein WAN43_07485 [Rhodomicrobium sp.]